MHRFDGICGGLQKLTEELCLQWISNWVKHTGISNIGLAGGVFMNVKLNMLINEHPVIDDVFLCLHAAMKALQQVQPSWLKRKIATTHLHPNPLPTYTWGPNTAITTLKKY